MSDNVIYKKDGAIGRIILARPEKKNSLDYDTLQNLISCFSASRENEDLCVIYEAQGKDFTVGADLKYGYHLMTDSARSEESRAYLASFQELTRVMLAHEGILLAGLHGWVIGGGFEILLSCDLRAATKDTAIMMPELSMGLMFSNASTKLLPRLIGESRAKQLLFLGDRIDAQQAFEFGLVFHIADDIDSLNRFLEGTAESIVKKGPLALRRAKQLVRENQEEGMSSVLDKELDAMIETGQSRDCAARIKAFVEKK
ncbi:MAG: enoyl-CoA hydratase/isomerase family protein [Candidatus Aminicenantes bacterium]|nr:enoyl-CoA hydratase/isomerase family protein [Candidatus Aminicenantes bacterium]